MESEGHRPTPDGQADQLSELAVYRDRAYRVVPGSVHWPQIVLHTFEDDPDMAGLVRCAATRYASGRNGFDHYRVGLEQLDALYESFDAFSAADDAVGGETRGETPVPSAAALAVHYADRLPERKERQRREFLEEEQAAAAANGFRTGVFAIYQGLVFAAADPPAVDGRIALTAADDEAARSLDGFDVGPGDETGRTRLVPLAELEQWYRSEWTFHLDGGQPFVSDEFREHRIRGRYVGSSWGYLNYQLNGGPEVARLLRDLTDLAEERVDLLAESRSGTGSAGSAGPGSRVGADGRAGPGSRVGADGRAEPDGRAGPGSRAESDG